MTNLFTISTPPSIPVTSPILPTEASNSSVLSKNQTSTTARTTYIALAIFLVIASLGAGVAVGLLCQPIAFALGLGSSIAFIGIALAIVAATRNHNANLALDEHENMTTSVPQNEVLPLLEQVLHTTPLTPASTSPPVEKESIVIPHPVGKEREPQQISDLTASPEYLTQTPLAPATPLPNTLSNPPTIYEKSEALFSPPSSSAPPSTSEVVEVTNHPPSFTTCLPSITQETNSVSPILPNQGSPYSYKKLSPMSPFLLPALRTPFAFSPRSSSNA